jgi:hypothetical protein
MNSSSPPQVWSPTMKVVFWFFIVAAAAICVGSIVWMLAGPGASGRQGARMLIQIVGNAALAIFFFAFKNHPEWLREKF